jgi:hypothetical protein
MEARFPNANVLNYTEPPPEDIINSPQQHIQVYIVKVPLDESLNPDMPPNVLRYHQLNNRKVFFYGKPYRKPGGDELTDLFIRNYMFYTSSKLPGIHRRVEIIKNDQVVLTPLQNGANDIEAKSTEIAQFVRKFETGNDDGKNLSPFTLVMKGACDAAVNGGLERYIAHFVTATYLQENPKDEPLVQRLITTIRAHVVLLERGVNVHRRLCGASLMPLQELMEQKLAKTKALTENLAMPT